MNKLEDISSRSTKELSLIVFNTEELYKNRFNLPVLFKLLDSRYIYTTSQLSILLKDLYIDFFEIDPK